MLSCFDFSFPRHRADGNPARIQSFPRVKSRRQSVILVEACRRGAENSLPPPQIGRFSAENSFTRLVAAPSPREPSEAGEAFCLDRRGGGRLRIAPNTLSAQRCMHWALAQGKSASAEFKSCLHAWVTSYSLFLSTSHTPPTPPLLSQISPMAPIYVDDIFSSARAVSRRGLKASQQDYKLSMVAPRFRVISPKPAPRPVQESTVVDVGKRGQRLDEPVMVCELSTGTVYHYAGGKSRFVPRFV